MDIVSRARNILLKPTTEWAVIDMEPSTAGDLYTKYLIPLGLIGPIASFIGLTVVGVSIPFIGTYRTPFVSGLVSAVVSFISVLVGMYVWALIIDALAPTFSGQRNMVAALKVAIFAATPALLAGILSLLPALGALQIIAALYGLYLLYRGLPVLMKSPPEKSAGYTALSVVCGILVSVVIGVLLMALHFTPLLGHGPALGAASGDAAAQGALAGIIGTAAGGSDDSRKAAETVASSIIAAGKSAEAASKDAEASAKTDGGTSASANSPDDTAKPDDAAKKEGAAAAAGIAAIGAMVGGGKAHVETVDFHALEATLPATVGTMQRSNTHGAKSSTAGFGVSTAEGDYGSGDARLHVKITDMGNASGLMAMGKLAFSMETESDSGYEKNVTVAGRKVHEKWTASGKTSELTTFVEDRFLVEVNGDGVDMPAAEGAVGAVDFGKLVALKH